MIDFEFWFFIINLAFNLITLVLLIIYAKDTWNLSNTTLDATKETAKVADTAIESVKVVSQSFDEELKYKDFQTAPMIFAFLEHAEDSSTHIYLTIRNCGKGVARNVKVSFMPELRPSKGFDLNHIKQLTENIPVLPPGKFIKHGFAVTTEYLNDSKSPLKYEVMIKFKGGIYDHEREFRQEISFDFFTRGTRANQISEISN